MKKRIFGLTKPSQLRAKKLLILAMLFFCSFALAKAQDPPGWEDLVPVYPGWFHGTIDTYFADPTIVNGVQPGNIELSYGNPGCQPYIPNSQRCNNQIVISFFSSNGTKISQMGTGYNHRLNQSIDILDETYWVYQPTVYDAVNKPAKYQIDVYSDCSDISYSGKASPKLEWWDIGCCHIYNQVTQESTPCGNCPGDYYGDPSHYRRRLHWKFPQQDVAWLNGQHMAQTPESVSCECCLQTTGVIDPLQNQKGDSK